MLVAYCSSRLAIFNSQSASNVIRRGESSSHSSQGAVAQGVFHSASPSPFLSTPDARAMFTSPSSSAPSETPASVTFTLPTNGAPMSMEELVQRSLANAQGTATVSVPPSASQATPPLPSYDGIQLIMLCTESSIPSVCECTHPSFQDPILRGEYLELVNLLCVIIFQFQYGSLRRCRGGHVEVWSNSQGKGFVMFSAWGKQCPRMNAL